MTRYLTVCLAGAFLFAACNDPYQDDPTIGERNTGENHGAHPEEPQSSEIPVLPITTDVAIGLGPEPEDEDEDVDVEKVIAEEYAHCAEGLAQCEDECQCPQRHDGFICSFVFDNTYRRCAITAGAVECQCEGSGNPHPNWAAAAFAIATNACGGNLHTMDSYECESSDAFLSGIASPIMPF